MHSNLCCVILSPICEEISVLRKGHKKILAHCYVCRQMVSLGKEKVVSIRYLLVESFFKILLTNNVKEFWIISNIDNN